MAVTMFLGRYQLGLFIEERQYLIVEGLIVIHFAEHSMSCPMYEVHSEPSGSCFIAS